MSTDVLSNMLSSLKNAAMTKKRFIEVMETKECKAVAKVLKEKGFLEEVKTFKNKESSFKGLRLDLAFAGNSPKITDIKRVSKPGRRLYAPSSELERVLNGLGVLVVSTSRGVMAGDEAKTKKLGGEVICKVW